MCGSDIKRALKKEKRENILSLAVEDMTGKRREEADRKGEGKWIYLLAFFLVVDGGGGGR